MVLTNQRLTVYGWSRLTKAYGMRSLMTIKRSTVPTPRALALAREHGCRFALLIDGSPSCGSGLIYDGAFAGRKHAGAGVTVALLRQHCIEVFTEAGIEALADRLSQ